MNAFPRLNGGVNRSDEFSKVEYQGCNYIGQVLVCNNLVSKHDRHRPPESEAIDKQQGKLR